MISDVYLSDVNEQASNDRSKAGTYSFRHARTSVKVVTAELRSTEVTAAGQTPIYWTSVRDKLSMAMSDDHYYMNLLRPYLNARKRSI